MKVAKWGLVILLVSPVGIAAAQGQTPAPSQQEDSLAAAARRTRDQKNKGPKAARIWSNDNLPKNPDGLSVVGQTPPAQDNAHPPPAAPAGAPKSSTDTSKKADTDASLAAAKDQLQTLQNDLDILRRKYTVDQQAYSSKPLFSADEAGAAALNAEQDQIDAKQQEISDAQKKIEDLQAKPATAANTSTPKPPN